MDLFNPAFWIFVGVIGGIYAIMAIGLYVQFSLAGLPNFGHVAFMAIAAYTMAILVIRLAMPLPIAAAAGILAAVIFGLILGIPSLRLRSDYLAIATVAGGEIVRYLAMNLPDLTGGPLGSIGLAGPGEIALYNQDWQSFLDRLRGPLASALGGPVSRDLAMMIIVWALTMVLLLALWHLERSPWGRVLKAIREDETAVTAVGKNVFAFKLQALTLGAILGAISGLLLAWQIGVFSPDDYQPTLTFYAYLILILGGMNRIWAIPVGAALFSILYSGTRFLNFFPLSLIDSGSRAFLRLFLVGFLLVLFMAVRPEGMLGNRRELMLEK
ncbi:MAG: branched-chain amino acid ABC transporter permease [Proteobacteria bacterium]|nr:branched-chain amino acid ABC transporter permease [Pseudomonadota bacterium]